MKKINREIRDFFGNQGCVIVTTIDKDGFPHSACKGIIEIKGTGKIYLFDLYRKETFENLKRNPRISVTAFDEHKFTGYCLKGKARIIGSGKIDSRLAELWDRNIAGRLTQRLLKNIREEKRSQRHPEVLLPKPEYMIYIGVEQIVNLAPQHLR